MGSTLSTKAAPQARTSPACFIYPGTLDGSLRLACWCQDRRESDETFRRMRMGLTSLTVNPCGHETCSCWIFPPLLASRVLQSRHVTLPHPAIFLLLVSVVVSSSRGESESLPRAERQFWVSLLPLDLCNSFLQTPGWGRLCFWASS